ncbi:MAG: beta-propeller domain-containing protein, partial [Chloroflexi bacterium]|nr:beta-propeller domain-containing protein [Chloroflexota bacterium]
FSMSEHEGHLRVATTDGSAGWQGDDRGPSSESYVTVLREDDGELVRIGRVDGLGRGERIYAVRFLGDLGYVVTFRETDPLYVVDLADPTRPALRGELKIPGYSSYLHPMGEGLLIGVGQDATLSGQTRGTQISIFDVSDPTDPKRLHQHTLEGGSSEAEYDHHAFLYWPETGQLVLPVESWEQRPSGAEKLTTGAAVFAVSDTAGIDRAGQISHQGRGSDAAVGSEDRWEEDWMARIRRSLVIGHRLYTMSDRGLLVSDLETLADVEWLGF